MLSERERDAPSHHFFLVEKSGATMTAVEDTSWYVRTTALQLLLVATVVPVAAIALRF